MDRQWRDWTWDELANEAQTGTRGQGAVVEASRRLTDRIDAFRTGSDRYSRQMFWLTVVLTVLTLVMAIPVIPVIKGWFTS